MYAVRTRDRQGLMKAFEAGLAQDGVTLVKLFVHVTQKTQDNRIRARLADPWKRWKTGTDDFRNRGKRAAYLVAMLECSSAPTPRRRP